MHVVLGGRDAGQVLLEHRPGADPAGADGRGDLDRARPRQAARAGAGAAGAHGASPRMRGTRKRSASTAGAWRQYLVAVEAGDDDVVAPHVGERQGVGGRGHAGGVEGLHVLGVVEHRAQLPVKRSSSSGVSASRARRATWATSSGEMRVGMPNHARRDPAPGYRG